jgi:hypothetical protein
LAAAGFGGWIVVMGMHGWLLSLSPKRKAVLVDDLSLLHEVLEEHRRTPVRGVLEIGKAWHALDLIVAGENSSGALGDAVLGRRGSMFGKKGSFGTARLLPPEKVRVVADALDALNAELVTQRYSTLKGKTVHGEYGPKKKGKPGDDDDDDDDDSDNPDEERELAELERLYQGLRALYRAAANDGHSVLALID